jgi:hypothetical protein
MALSTPEVYTRTPRKRRKKKKNPQSNPKQTKPKTHKTNPTPHQKDLKHECLQARYDIFTKTMD